MRSRRGQAGITLMEILLALAIASILMVPLGAWAYGTIKANIVSRDELGRASATGLLNIYFLRDVAAARAVVNRSTIDAPGEALDCTGVPSASAGTPVLRLMQSGNESKSVVYVVVGSDTPAKLHRHVCKADGSYESGNKLIGSIDRDSVTTGCFNPASQQVQCDAPDAIRTSITVRPWSDGRVRAPITVSGTRRTNGAGTGTSTSNPPDPRFDITPGTRGDADTVFTVRNTSTDPDGDTLEVTWDLPSNATFTGALTDQQITFRLPSSGQVTLRVRDPFGNENAGSVWVDVVNRAPVIGASSCSPAGDRRYQLSTTVTDPDGDPLDITWTDAAGTTLQGANPIWNVPAGLTGEQTLQISASDGRGKAQQVAIQCDVGGGTGGPGGPGGGGGVEIQPAPDLAGVVNAAPPGGGVSVTFTATEPLGTSNSWELYLRGAPSPVNSTSGVNSWTLTFSYAEAGDYDIVRITDGVAGPRVPFRVNAMPALSLVSPGQSGSFPARVVMFTSTATDPDGAVVTTHWDFGDGGQSDEPAGNVSHTYAAPGNYQVTFTATDNNGAVATVVLPVTVEETP